MEEFLSEASSMGMEERVSVDATEPFHTCVVYSTHNRFPIPVFHLHALEPFPVHENRRQRRALRVILSTDSAIEKIHCFLPSLKRMVRRRNIDNVKVRVLRAPHAHNHVILNTGSCSVETRLDTSAHLKASVKVRKAMAEEGNAARPL
jgi:hypothetical protein